MKPYKTTQGESSASYEIQRSKFYTHTKHVESEEEARAFIQEQKKAYFDARHNCSAYVLGADGAKQKSNDDGEPGGTAGNPILEAIKKNELTNIVVVVTRYFGGIKLGAGGLIRAYSHAAVLGIEAATVLAMTPFQQLDVTVGYDMLATVEHWMRQHEIRSLEADYADNVILHLLIEPAASEDVQAALTDLTAGRADLTPGDEQLIAIPAS